MSTTRKKSNQLKTSEDEVEYVRGGLEHYSTEGEHTQYWMDTGEPRLHSVLGSEAKGIPYGKIFEIFGPESQGKTTLALDLLASAQVEGAECAWIDLESSWDPDYAASRGVDTEKVRLFQPYIGTFGKSKEQRLITAEELLEEVEAWMELKHRKNPDGKIFAGLDSLAALLTEVEASGGIADQNMRTNFALPTFLSKLLRRWVAYMRVYNVMLILINQVRTKPNVYGDPEDSPGGKALRLYCHIRVKIRRSAGGQVKKNGKQIGIKGVITNIKNKAGGGSIEKLKIGYKIYFDGSAKFIEAEEVKEDV